MLQMPFPVEANLAPVQAEKLQNVQKMQKAPGVNRLTNKMQGD